VLVLRDFVGWPADQCAAELDTSVASVNSALQRARSSLRTLLGPDRDDWRAGRVDDARSREVVRRYIDAIEHSDDAAIAALLRADVVVSHQPGAGGNDRLEPAWYAGRELVIAAWAPALHSPQPLEMRMVERWVNRTPAVVSSIRLPGTTEYRAFAHSILDIRTDGIAAVVNLLPAPV
jgi:RNA polymerase sigma-70 factor (ECF subfamily)